MQERRKDRLQNCFDPCTMQGTLHLLCGRGLTLEGLGAWGRVYGLGSSGGVS